MPGASLRCGELLIELEQVLQDLLIREVRSPAVGGVDGQDAVGVARHHLRHALDEVGRVQPVLSRLVETSSGFGDGLGARVGGVVGGRDIGRKAFGEGEGLEAGGRSLAGRPSYTYDVFLAAAVVGGALAAGQISRAILPSIFFRCLVFAPVLAFALPVSFVLAAASVIVFSFSSFFGSLASAVTVAACRSL